jgi:hypothetical protein
MQKICPRTSLFLWRMYQVSSTYAFRLIILYILQNLKFLYFFPVNNHLFFLKNYLHLINLDFYIQNYFVKC